MRGVFVPIGILTGIIALCLWTGAGVNADTARWLTQIQNADDYARINEWTDALSALRGSYEDWSGKQTWLHIIARHDMVDDAERIYIRSLIAADMEDLSAFRTETSDLRNQLRLLAETERFTWGNIF